MRLLTCREVSGMLGRGEFDDARGLAKALAWLHLLYCRHCRRYRRQLRLLARAAREWAGGLAERSRVEALERRILSGLG
jgi:hypothetical protein